ncbi:MAG: NAD(P)H-hydrate dehydratase [Caldimonas sp.]
MATEIGATVDIDARLLHGWPLPQPGGDADKEDRGSTLVIAGSHEMPGAAMLAATSALRAGAGKLMVATGASIAPGTALALAEARVVALPETEAGGPAADAMARIEAQLARADAVLIGPGMLDAAATRAFTRRLLKRVTNGVVVLDALAMDVVLDLRRFERAPLLTPHAGEMAHLTGVPKEGVIADPERHAREAALRWNAIVVLKGATTYIATPEGDCWRHAGGQAGLGTSGSGDVLAGIIVGLAARGAPLAQAAAWGVALHARAGSALAERLGPIGFLARELPAEIPALLEQLAR